MAENSAISWTDHTFNPWIGCTRVSPACDGCYADALMGMGGRMKRAAWGGPGAGEGTRVRTSQGNWMQPLRWNARAAKDGTRPFVFCASLADVFDNAVPATWRRDLFDLIRATPNLTWLLLTKRPGNIVKLFREAMHLFPGGEAANWPFNAAIGCTVVTQEEADRDIPKLLAAKAALNPAFAFLSMEPLLGPVDLRQWFGDYGCGCGWGGSNTLMYCNNCGWRGHGDETDNCGGCGEALSDYYACPECDAHDGDGGSFGPNSAWLDWIITGGETDQGQHHARPAHTDWFRGIRDQCAAAGVPFHHKQNGEWAPLDNEPEPNPVHRVGKRIAGRLIDGLLHDARPEVRS